MANAILDTGFTSGGVDGVYNFRINGAPPFTTLKAFVNGIDYTSLMAPGPNYSTGDDLITDQYGSADGRIIIIRSYGSLAQDGNLTVLFYDAISNSLVSTLLISQTSKPPSDVSTRPAQTIPSGNGASTVDDTSTGAKLGAFASTVTPYTQTFTVPPAQSGAVGITITGIDLYFGQKDDRAPVGIQLRKIINGVPSSTEVISGSLSAKMPNEVYVDANNEIVTNADGTKSFARQPVLPTPTTFRLFARLEAGAEYGISIITPSKYYALFTTKYGANYPKQPNVGKLFKSQNVGTWIEEENTGICFKLRKAKFETGTKYFEMASEAMPRTLYDSIYLGAQTVQDNGATVSFTFKGVDATSCTSPTVNFYTAAVPIEQNTPIKLLTRKAASIQGGMVLGVTMQNSSVDTSPVLDKASLGLMTLQNEIQPYDLDASNSELLPEGGFVLSKYISKVTTLANDFDSTGLEVRLDVNRKIGTDIEVFCRVLSPKDIANNNTIDTLPWRRMPIFNQRANITNPNSLSGIKQYVGLSDTAFNTEVYKILEEDSSATTGVDNLYYTRLVNGVSTRFTTFNMFQVKVVMYSNDPGIVPKISNLIATAVV